QVVLRRAVPELAEVEDRVDGRGRVAPGGPAHVDGAEVDRAVGRGERLRVQRVAVEDRPEGRGDDALRADDVLAVRDDRRGRVVGVGQAVEREVGGGQLRVGSLHREAGGAVRV